jgi:hypothetical protein
MAVIKSRNGAGEVAQVVEYLTAKHEALSSNPSTAKKEKVTSGRGDMEKLETT